jgi:hypothetical protein
MAYLATKLNLEEYTYTDLEKQDVPFGMAPSKPIGAEAFMNHANCRKTVGALILIAIAAKREQLICIA